MRWIRRGSTAWPVRIQEAYEEVQQILEALERRDAAAARQAMRQHIQAIIDFRKNMETLPRRTSAVS